MIVAPALRTAQAEAWHALFEVHERLPAGWAVVGGQMVQSHCWERGSTSARPTNDADTVLDVRAHPTILLRFTTVLRDCGFVADGQSFEGHQHRWVRGGAQIDVLIPRFLGERASSRRGVTGGTTLAAPGAQGAVDRARPVEVRVNGRDGVISRPTLQGALLAKAAAVEIPGDDHTRHLVDIATLASLVSRHDRVGVNVTETERRRIRAALSLIERDPLVCRVADVDPIVTDRLRLAFA